MVQDSKKSRRLKAHAVIIPREHQSAPKEHWADKEIAKAAEEINSGQFTPTLSDDDLLPVALSRGLKVPNPKTQSVGANIERAEQTRDSLLLAQHPRVQEALAKFAQEKSEARNTQEYAEKTQMLHELTAMAKSVNKWDGQGRWLGKENEEMRVVNIMTPFQFLARLEGVIGEGRVMLNRFAVAKRVALLSPQNDPRIKKRSALWTPDDAGSGVLDRSKDFVQVGTLQYPCGPEWMVMRVDEYGIPTTAKYLGWRTALLSMIDLGVISEKEAHEAFPLRTGPAGDWYRQQLFEIRSRDGVMN